MNRKNETERLREELEAAQAVVIGAGAGLSASAGFAYEGERFRRYFQDFADKYGFEDMYSGGFYPYGTLQEYWAYWSRYIWINRYQDAPKQVYRRLRQLMKDRDYFVLTTNVDHQFQKAGFDKERLFYTQGDYGLWQCSRPCHKLTYDNEEAVRRMAEAQGFAADETDGLYLPAGAAPKMSVPGELVPRCPKCGKPMTMNLRADETFVEDMGWQAASQRYSAFLQRHRNSRTLFLELGTGYNTPTIIKYAFWQMAYRWPKAVYACVNLGEAFAPEKIRTKSICINEDIGAVVEEL